MIRLIACILLLSASCCFAIENSKLKVGDYLSDDYISSLIRYQSAIKSDKENKIQMAIVDDVDNATEIILTINFHEGAYSANIINGMVEKISDTEYIQDISVIDNKNFIVTVGNNKIKMVYVENAKKYVADQLLVGKYADNSGNKYYFNSDGTGLLGKVKLEYEYGLDHTEIPYEYIIEKKNRNVYKIQRNKDVIEIYKTSGEMAEKISKKPAYTIKKLK